MQKMIPASKKFSVLRICHWAGLQGTEKSGNSTSGKALMASLFSVYHPLTNAPTGQTAVSGSELYLNAPFLYPNMETICLEIEKLVQRNAKPAHLPELAFLILGTFLQPLFLIVVSNILF